MLGMGILGSRLAMTDRRNRLGVKSCYSECGPGCHDECLEQVCSHGYPMVHFQFDLWLLSGCCLGTTPKLARHWKKMKFCIKEQDKALAAKFVGCRPVQLWLCEM